MAQVFEIHQQAVDQDAAAIGSCYQEALESQVGAARILIKTSHMLMAKKVSLPHGKWQHWFEDNEKTIGFGDRTSRRLLQLAVRITDVNVRYTDEEAIEICAAIWGNDKVVRGTQGTGDNEWFTPPEYIELARQVLGDIDLDPASNPLAQEVVQAKRFFTKEDNGLSKDWIGRVWLNPPYAQPAISEFVNKMVSEVRANRVSEGIMLTHNYSDTEWFQTAAPVATAICHTKGRIKFYDPEGKAAAPTQGQTFFYFGKNQDKFWEVFRNIGFVVTPYDGSVS